MVKMQIIGLQNAQPVNDTATPHPSPTKAQGSLQSGQNDWQTWRWGVTTRDCRFPDTAGHIGTQEALIGCPRPVQRSVRQTPAWREGAQSPTRDRAAAVN